MSTEEATEEIWTINRCTTGYIQLFSISNRVDVDNHIVIYFDQYKYTNNYYPELILSIGDLIVARMDMEGKRVVLGGGVNLLEFLGQQKNQQE